MAPFCAQGLLGGIAAVLAIVSILVGYTQVLKGWEKAQWLTNRFWTERIRQFHFQLADSSTRTGRRRSTCSAN
jgi:hypothetical protein